MARLATVDEAGAPHVVPICFACGDSAIYTVIDEKPKTVRGSELRRVRNILALTAFSAAVVAAPAAIAGDDVNASHVQAMSDTNKDGMVSKAEAMKMVEDGALFDLLFTDVVLPDGISGRELSDKMLKLRPGMPVLYTTGYTRNAIVHHGRLDPDVHLLTLPLFHSFGQTVQMNAGFAVGSTLVLMPRFDVSGSDAREW